GYRTPRRLCTGRYSHAAGDTRRRVHALARASLYGAADARDAPSLPDTNERDHLSRRRVGSECRVRLLRARDENHGTAGTADARISILHHVPDVAVRRPARRPLSADDPEPRCLSPRLSSPGLTASASGRVATR